MPIAKNLIKDKSVDSRPDESFEKVLNKVSTNQANGTKAANNGIKSDDPKNISNAKKARNNEIVAKIMREILVSYMAKDMTDASQLGEGDQGESSDLITSKYYTKVIDWGLKQFR